MSLPKGYQWSEEYKIKKRLAYQNNPNVIEAGRKTGKLNKGRKLSEEEKLKRSMDAREKRFGNAHWNWKGGITPIRKKLYFSDEYKLWRNAVFERDHFTCVWCGKVGEKLEADHIKSWADFPELRFAIDNGRTLCKKCHMRTDTYGIHK
jgi:hypothetical protein